MKSLLASIPVLLVLASCGGGDGGDTGTPNNPPVPPPTSTPPPSVTLEASPQRIAALESTVLTWTSSNAASCVASDDWTGSKATSGTEASGALDATATFVLACTGAGGTTSVSVTVEVDAVAGTPRFPLHVEDRHLVDAAGNPFLVQGDSAWSLIAQLNREDTQTYLDDRKARGFNTLLISLVEHRFASRAPANIYGDAPFVRAGDFSTPNEAYFEHADWVLNRARQMGFLILLTPAYLGFDGGAEGWYADLSGASDATLTNYGRFVGARYGSLGNIVWVHGGDYDPPQRRVVRLIAAGVAAVDAIGLATAHGAPETAPGEFWRGEAWLSFDNVYSYNAIDAQAKAAYQRLPTRPFILIETAYENEHGTTGKSIRTAAYTALLEGAAGNVFGNNPIWHFNSPTGPGSNGTQWKTALGQPGSTSMTRLWSVIGALRWWTLEPATDRVMTSGAAPGGVAALARDRDFALAYLPSTRTIRVDLGLLAGPSVAATWINPANGTRTGAPGSPLAAGASQSLTPPASGNPDGDWVLLLESQAR